MAHRLNVMLSDKAWSMLQEVPKGKRSEVVSEFLVTGLALRRRQGAMKRLDHMRKELPPPADTRDVVEILGEDRSRDH